MICVTCSQGKNSAHATVFSTKYWWGTTHDWHEYCDSYCKHILEKHYKKRRFSTGCRGRVCRGDKIDGCGEVQSRHAHFFQCHWPIIPEFGCLGCIESCTPCRHHQWRSQGIIISLSTNTSLLIKLVCSFPVFISRCMFNLLTLVSTSMISKCSFTEIATEEFSFHSSQILYHFYCTTCVQFPRDFGIFPRQAHIEAIFNLLLLSSTMFSFFILRRPFFKGKSLKHILYPKNLPSFNILTDCKLIGPLFSNKTIWFVNVKQIHMTAPFNPCDLSM